MKNWLHHIHNQPDHIRELAAILGTAVVGIIVLAVWFHSFKGDVYALLNPSQEPATEQQHVADTGSMFGSIGHAFSSGVADIGSWFHSSTTSPSSDQTNTTTALPSGDAHPLPVAGQR